MTSKLPYLNVGCGYSFHQDWTNIDFVSTGPGVIAHNLLSGIPLPDSSFKVVYHSHVLEHFKKEDGKKFIKDCHRVLGPNGTLRVAVPDLGKIISEYLRIVHALKENDQDPYLQASYDWIMLEMYDQTLRNQSGGGMAVFLEQDPLLNEDFLIQRCGYEVKAILDRIREARKQNSGSGNRVASRNQSSLKTNLSRIRSLPSKLRSALRKRILGDDYEEYFQIGKFRNSGEIHQWMYDEFSLGRLLKDSGFKDVRVHTAFDSRIENWNEFGLETVNGSVRKPDSLFMEGSK